LVSDLFSIMPLRLGTRASALARWQAEWVAAQLRQRGIEVELTPITTTGDHRRGAIAAIGGEGVFTKEIEAALLDGRIDLAVHSLKDLPTAAAAGLCLAAVPERAPAGDVLVSARAASLDELPKGAVVGTGSLRRRTQLLHFRRDLQMKDIRGNVDTRLRKLAEGGYDALVLAEAGLHRLGLDQHIAQVLPWEIVLPAPGQGAMALQTRADDEPTRRVAAELDHAPTRAAVTAERTLLAALQGGCLAPVAALGRVEADRLTLIGRVLSCDGARRIEAAASAPIAEADALGCHVADALLTQGAGELIRAARESL
jgi:hydroxymethylbilane synthase